MRGGGRTQPIEGREGEWFGLAVETLQRQPAGPATVRHRHRVVAATVTGSVIEQGDPNRQEITITVEITCGG